MLLMIVLAAFITITLILMLLYQYLLEDKMAVHNRMEHYVERKQQPLSSGLVLGGQTDRDLSGWRSLVRRMSRYFESPEWAKLLEHKLIQAGIPMRGSEFMVICTGLGLFGAVVLFIITGGRLGGILLGVVMGLLIPLMILQIKIDKRTKAFNDQLGDALILAANSLRTGYSFLQAIEMISKEMPKPISEEFGIVLKEMNLGITTEMAMNNLAKRVNSDDLDLVITAVLIQRQVGGNLSEVLDSIAGTIRERVRIKGQIRTLTAQGRISGIIIGILPIGIGLIIFMINPGYIKLLFTTPIGKMMLAGGVASLLIGVMFIRKIVSIEV